MTSHENRDVTELLVLWGNGDSRARDKLWPLVYQELRGVAGELMKGERAEHTLQPTALVNEAYLRMIEVDRVRYRDRRHFFLMASRVMRRVLVDHARARNAQKRDGGTRVTLEVSPQVDASPSADVLDLDGALMRLEELEPDKVRVVELKYFGGLTNGEAAEAMGCSEKTIQRHWKIAKLWLFRELTEGDADGF
jgi:RNA polymerase sigma factor (TIGR02999 family)